MKFSATQCIVSIEITRKACVAGHRDGDKATWDALLAEQISCNGRLYFKLAHGVLRNTQAAEDCCQQALLKAWQQRQQLRDPDSLRAWLARVVVNESLQQCRKGKVERRWTEDQLRRSSPQCAGPDLRLELRESVLQALEQLSEPTRTVVVLRAMQGMRGEEVGRLLECSEPTVSRYYQKGMERLRELLSDWQAPVGG